jgi:Flp pilus assembly protein TadG
MVSDRAIVEEREPRRRYAGRFPTLCRRFFRDDSAAVLMEFGFVVIPFFLLLFAVFQQGLLFFEEETFQTAITNASRLVYTGQATNSGYTQANFKQQVCNQLPFFLPCSTIAVNVRPYSDFASATITMPVDSNGNYDPTKATYNVGSAGTSIVVISGYALEPVLFPTMDPYYSNSGISGKVLITASAVFKNEPWS